MNLLLIIIGILIAIVLLRFWYYWREVLFIKNLNKTYASFFHEYSKLSPSAIQILEPSHPALKAITKLRRRKSHYIVLVKKAGFYQKGVITHENIGIQPYRVNHQVADLIDNADPKYLTSVMESFDNIIGYFEDRAKESFDPFFWIKALLNSPKTIANFVVDIIKHAITGH